MTSDSDFSSSSSDDDSDVDSESSENVFQADDDNYLNTHLTKYIKREHQQHDSKVLCTAFFLFRLYGLQFEDVKNSNISKDANESFANLHNKIMGTEDSNSRLLPKIEGLKLTRNLLLGPLVELDSVRAWIKEEESEEDQAQNGRARGLIYYQQKAKDDEVNPSRFFVFTNYINETDNDYDDIYLPAVLEGLRKLLVAEKNNEKVVTSLINRFYQVIIAVDKFTENEYSFGWLQKEFENSTSENGKLSREKYVMFYDDWTKFVKCILYGADLDDISVDTVGLDKYFSRNKQAETEDEIFKSITNDLDVDNMAISFLDLLSKKEDTDEDNIKSIRSTVLESIKQTNEQVFDYNNFDYTPPIRDNTCSLLDGFGDSQPPFFVWKSDETNQNPRYGFAPALDPAWPLKTKIRDLNANKNSSEVIFHDIKYPTHVSAAIRLISMYSKEDKQIVLTLYLHILERCVQSSGPQSSSPTSEEFITKFTDFKTALQIKEFCFNYGKIYRGESGKLIGTIPYISKFDSIKEYQGKDYQNYTIGRTDNEKLSKAIRESVTAVMFNRFSKKSYYEDDYFYTKVINKNDDICFAFLNPKCVDGGLNLDYKEELNKKPAIIEEVVDEESIRNNESSNSKNEEDRDSDHEEDEDYGDADDEDDGDADHEEDEEGDGDGGDADNEDADDDSSDEEDEEPEEDDEESEEGDEEYDTNAQVYDDMFAENESNKDFDDKNRNKKPTSNRRNMINRIDGEGDEDDSSDEEDGDGRNYDDMYAENESDDGSSDEDSDDDSDDDSSDEDSSDEDSDDEGEEDEDSSEEDSDSEGENKFKSAKHTNYGSRKSTFKKNGKTSIRDSGTAQGSNGRSLTKQQTSKSTFKKNGKTSIRDSGTAQGSNGRSLTKQQTSGPGSISEYQRSCWQKEVEMKACEQNLYQQVHNKSLYNKNRDKNQQREVNYRRMIRRLAKKHDAHQSDINPIWSSPGQRMTPPLYIKQTNLLFSGFMHEPRAMSSSDLVRSSTDLNI